MSRLTVVDVWEPIASGLAASFTHRPAMFSAPAPRGVDPAVFEPVDKYRPFVPYVVPEGSRVAAGTYGPPTPDVE